MERAIICGLHYNEEECTGHLDHILRLKKKLDLWKFSRSVTRVPCYAIAAASEGANIPQRKLTQKVDQISHKNTVFISV